MPGQGQEDVVEGGTAQGNIEYYDALGVETAQRLHQDPGAASHRRGEAPGVVIDSHGAAG